MASGKKPNWLLLYVVSGVCDFVQFFIIEAVFFWFGGSGAVANEILDPIVGAGLGWYMQKHGVNILGSFERLAWMFGTEATAALTGGWVQLWIIAIWRIHASYRKGEGAAIAAQEQQAALEAQMNGPAYQGGRREPRTANSIAEPIDETEPRQTRTASVMAYQPAPANVDGVRRPNAQAYLQSATSTRTASSGGSAGSTTITVRPNGGGNKAPAMEETVPAA